MCNEAIARLLESKRAQELDDGSGDVVFALFLEPHPPPPASDHRGSAEKALDFAIQHCQPSPAMVHVELIVPCTPGAKQPTSFATYIGCHSGWQSDPDANLGYYLGNNANHWRAVPVFGKQAARRVRDACSHSSGVPYSLARYFTASWPLRAFSGLVPDGDKAPAHCATLTARVLRHSIGACLRHPSAWYGPASLYAELCGDLRDQRIRPESTLMAPDTTRVVEALLRSSDAAVAMLSDAECTAAVRALTLKAAAAEAFGDSAACQMTQRQLANALLRWSVMRLFRDE